MVLFADLNFTETHFLNCLQSITTPDINGHFVLQITLQDLQSLTLKQLDIFNKYKQTLKAIEAYQQMQLKMKQAIKNKLKTN